MLTLKESRIGTDSIKWDGVKSVFGYEDVLPMWVADMDFAVSPAIQEAIMKRVMHSNYGYTQRSEQYADAVVTWLNRRHQISLDQDAVVFTPGVVTAISLLIKTMTEVGDSVLIQTPVYTPFYHAIQQNDRTLVTSGLKLINGRYDMDFVDLEDKLKRPEVKAMIFCHPHNPMGRVWDKSEVDALVKLCYDNGVYLISDEIHMDLCFDQNHYSVLRTEDKYHTRLAVCTAPSKTFNIAGLHMSNILIPNTVLRARYEKEINRLDLGGINPLGQVAVVAAYTESDAWYDAMMDMIIANFKHIQNRLKDTPFKVLDSQGTYLCLIDFSELDTDPVQFKKRLLEDAKVAVQMGDIFGLEIKTSFRLNFGCSREQLDDCLDRLLKLV